jgi:hypothetical protein
MSYACSLAYLTTEQVIQVASNGMTFMSDEFEKMWTGAVMACFKVVSQKFRGWTAENRERSHSG